MPHRSDRSGPPRHIDARSVLRGSGSAAPSDNRGSRRTLRDFMQRVARPVALRKSRGIAARSDDGVIEFQLLAQPGRLLVQRIERRPSSERVVHQVNFASCDAFDRWCLTDRLQFQYPLLYANLRRSGHELFDITG